MRSQCKDADVDTVTRTVRVRGRELPAFIYNGRPYFTRIRVYEDGMCDCWGMADRQLFADKVRSGWVRVAVERGDCIGVHHLGNWVVGASSWLRDPEAFLAHVSETIRELNPDMRNLLSFDGHDVKIVDGVRWAWPPTGNPEPTKKPPERLGRELRGTQREGLWREQGKVYLVALRAFADGEIQLGGLPEPRSIREAQLDELVASGQLGRGLEPGEWLEIHGLGRFEVAQCLYAVPGEDTVGELRGLLAKLRGEPSVSTLCGRAYEAWEIDPNPETVEALRAAYFAVPEHLRTYLLGDMDLRDRPIRAALGLDLDEV